MRLGDRVFVGPTWLWISLSWDCTEPKNHKYMCQKVSVVCLCLEKDGFHQRAQCSCWSAAQPHSYSLISQKPVNIGPVRGTTGRKSCVVQELCLLWDGTSLMRIRKEWHAFGRALGMNLVEAFQCWG